MRRHRPDPRQGLFRWVWHDPDDDRPDDDCDDEPEPAPPPLRGRVRQRHAPKTLTRWGVPITLAKPAGPRRATDKGSPQRFGIGLSYPRTLAYSTMARSINSLTDVARSQSASAATASFHASDDRIIVIPLRVR